MQTRTYKRTVSLSGFSHRLVVLFFSKFNIFFFFGVAFHSTPHYLVWRLPGSYGQPKEDMLKSSLQRKRSE